MAIGTNRKYLLKALSKFNISEDDVDLMLLDSPKLDPKGLPDVKGCKLAIYKSLSTIIPLADITESGYSTKWNMGAIKLWYASLCAELGKKNAATPTIRNRSNLW